MAKTSVAKNDISCIDCGLCGGDHEITCAFHVEPEASKAPAVAWIALVAGMKAESITDDVTEEEARAILVPRVEARFGVDLVRPLDNRIEIRRPRVNTPTRRRA